MRLSAEQCVSRSTRIEIISVRKREGRTCSQVLRSSAGLPSRSTRAGPLGCVPILHPHAVSVSSLRPPQWHGQTHQNSAYVALLSTEKVGSAASCIMPCKQSPALDPLYAHSLSNAPDRDARARTCSCATVLSRPNFPQAYCCTTLWSSGMMALALSLGRRKEGLSMRPHEPHRGSVLDSPGSSRTDERKSKAWHRSSSCECEQ